MKIYIVSIHNVLAINHMLKLQLWKNSCLNEISPRKNKILWREVLADYIIYKILNTYYIF